MPELREAQRQWARHLRDPQSHAGPAGVETRRLQVYRDLVFNNIEGFLRSGFPVLHSLHSPPRWRNLVREFIRSHVSHSPYFLEISQEFLAFLMQEYQPDAEDPPFLLELAHYEWVELALDVATDELPAPRAPVGDDLLDNRLTLSPLAWLLSYRYPVHLIGPGCQPDAPGEPVYLLVWRNRACEVAFMVLNAATARMLELLRDRPDLGPRGVLMQVATEIGQPPEGVLHAGSRQLADLLGRDILVPAA